MIRLPPHPPDSCRPTSLRSPRRLAEFLGHGRDDVDIAVPPAGFGPHLECGPVHDRRFRPPEWREAAGITSSTSGWTGSASSAPASISASSCATPPREIFHGAERAAPDFPDQLGLCRRTADVGYHRALYLLRERDIAVPGAAVRCGRPFFLRPEAEEPVWRAAPMAASLWRKRALPFPTRHCRPLSIRYP